jgi:hypothetical protein
MNPSDDEVKSADEVSEVNEDLLEPQAIPDERIVRHAERADSYREAPTLGNDEEIIQPPLEPESSTQNDDVTEKIAELQKEEQVLMDALNHTDATPTVEQSQREDTNSDMAQDDVTSIVEKDEPVIPQSSIPENPVTQVDIEPLGSHAEDQLPKPSDAASETISAKSEDSIPVPVVAPVPENNQSQATPQDAPQTSGEQVVYHTVSGGPETLYDKRSSELKASGVIQTTDTAVRTNDMASSG